MFKITQRYLATGFIPPFVASVLFFVSFLLTFQLFKIIRIVIGRGVEFITVLELIGHIAISFLPFAIPVSGLFAASYIMSRLSEDSEIIAMRSFGIAKWRLYLPFLLLSLLIGVTIYALNQRIIPYSKREFKNSVIRLSSKGLVANIHPGKFFTDIPGITLFATKSTGIGKQMKDVFITVNQGGATKKTILARQGRLIKKEGSKSTQGSISLYLQDGNIVEQQGDELNITKILFQEYEFPISSSNYQTTSITKDSMRASDQLLRIIQQDDSKDGKGAVKTRLEYWSRVNTPFLTIIFIWLGFSLGIKRGRGRGRSTGPITFSLLVLYYLFFFLFISMARKGTMPATYAIFTPTLLLSFAAGWFYHKLDWPS
ncbi:MAG: YjgP/YjgQ family permease [Bdellovibrionales bacterium]|jgi:lipopolysaccharide export system permease protein|nr:YjgP/YjgQ family permease [Bdellovibrionales bacterium]MBT3525002.1 YjgP/YjgQ family permease [Bdellovibrionales bacterium]MBT7670081.1 YjgP/YjgQ family permease [Bdellovibrionales bacterium]MBT7767911.1 YjgP/YjgQ family permease [Bdellovibrionales bacterium]